MVALVRLVGEIPKGGPMGLVRADVRGSADPCPESRLGARAGMLPALGV